MTDETMREKEQLGFWDGIADVAKRFACIIIGLTILFWGPFVAAYIMAKDKEFPWE